MYQQDNHIKESEKKCQEKSGKILKKVTKKVQDKKIRIKRSGKRVRQNRHKKESEKMSGKVR